MSPFGLKLFLDSAKLSSTIFILIGYDGDEDGWRCQSKFNLSLKPFAVSTPRSTGS